MTKLPSVTAGFVVAAAVVAGTTMAVASPLAETAVWSHAVKHHFVLVDHTGPTTFDDAAPNGLSVGDSFTFSERLDTHGKKVGVAGGRCTEVTVTAAATSQLCTITAVLKRGQFTVEGIARYRSSTKAGAVRYGIVGGTGAYRSARGQVTVTPIKDGSDRIVVDLVIG